MKIHPAHLRQRMAVVVRATFATLLLGTVLAPVGNAAVEPVRPVGAFQFLGPAAADSKARLWYEFVIPNSVNKQTVYGIKTRDLDTLKPRHTIALPSTGLVFRNNVQPIVANTNRAQLYAVYYDGSNAPHIAVVDGKAGKIAADFAALASPSDRSTHVVYGLGYHAPTDSLYVAWQVDTTPLANKLVSSKLMVSELDGRTGAVRWSVQLDGCTAFTTRSQTLDATAVYRSATRPEVYLSCRTGKASRNLDPGAPYVVKLNLRPSGPPTIERFVVPGSAGAMAFDSVHDRFFISIGFGTQSGVMVFDGRHEAFIGLIPGAIGTFGLDEERGRFYGCGNNAGLVVTDAGIATPTPLGDVYKVPCVYAAEPAVVDSGRRQVFVKTTDVNANDTWVIVRDDSRPYVPEVPDNPDAATVDVPERAGVTESTFASSAAAYGMRTTLVGGPRGAAENWTTQTPYQVANGVATGMHEATGSAPGGPYSQDPPNIAYANRDIWLGRVSEAKLDTDSARATGTGADRNAYVDSDFAALSNPEVLGQHPGNSAPAKLAWPAEYEQASCLSLGGTTDKPKVERDPDLKLDCSMGKSVVAEAVGPRHPVSTPNGEITVGDATSKVTLTRDAKLGALTTVVAQAKNVAIGGVAFINDITVTAKTWAKGRKGSAGSSYERVFSGVRINGPDGKPAYLCNPPADCNEYQVVTQLNAALGNRMRVRLPNPDTTLRGTPGGAKSVIQRDMWEHLEQQTLNGQAGDDTTMPGVEFEIVLDNLGQSRVLVQLAGVSAESTYNIFALPTFGEFPDAPQQGPAGQPTVRTGGGGGTGGGDDAGKPVVTKGAPQTLTQTFVDKVRSGMRWAFGYNKGAPLVFVTWALFSLPIYLGVRRRLLGNVLKGGQ